MKHRNPLKLNQSLLKDYLCWDIINWSAAIDFWREKIELKDQHFQCLELGAQNGGLSLWLAMEGNKVICSDVFDPQLKSRKTHSKYLEGELINYEIIDATNIPYKSHFDLIIFKSILGGINKNKQNLAPVVIDQIYEALKPNGKVLFAENASSSKLHQFFRKKFVAWGYEWNYFTLNELKVLFKKFSVLDYDTTGFLGAFGRTEKQRNFLGKIDRFLISKIVPQNMRYIVFGVAVKAEQ
ncbi:MAG: class I SAM-dependent methyltransferase [Bacteroidetes bacterium]|nr:class I SAM-dependent methyltransferase [Bacteroidota bacterium]